MTNASRERCPRLVISRVRRLLVTSYLRQVPIAVIAAWLGHASAAFTLSVYAHSQDDALKAAATSFGRVVTTRDTETGSPHRSQT
jgi:integrase